MPEWLGTALATLVVALPALTGLLLLVGPVPARRVGLAGALASGASLLLVITLWQAQAQGVFTLWQWSPELQFVLSWRLHEGTLGLAGLVAFVGALVMQYAGAYFGNADKRRRAVATLLLFEASMLGLLLADNLFALFMFWELTGLCSFFLINTDADQRDDTFAAAQQALVITAGGALPMLLAFIVLAGHSSSLTELATLQLPVSTQNLVFLLILPAVVTKSAQVPLHFWLPGAMAAPTPISAFLHSATMVKAGLVLLIYCFPICGQSVWWSLTLVPLGGLTCLWGSYRALCEDDIKLLMAWSTVSQLGLMLLTLGLGTPLAIRAGILYLFAHAIFKAGLFAAVGAIDHSAHSRRLADLGGLRTRTGLLFWWVLILCGSMAGLPPFAGFLSKELVLEKVLLRGPGIHDLAVLAIIIGSIGTVAYTTRFLVGVFAGAPRSEGARQAQPPPRVLKLMPATMGLVGLVGGLSPEWIDDRLLEPVSRALLGQPLAAPSLALWHGVTVPLLLSLMIITLGWLTYRILARRHLPRGPVALSGPHLFARWLEGLARLGRWCNRALAGLSPGVYFAALLVVGAAGSLPLLPALAGLGQGPWHPDGVVLLVVQMAALIGLIALRGRLVRVLLLSVVGYTVALLYRLLHAPDLVLTQLLVEVLTTIFFALTVRFFAHQESPRPLAFSVPRLLIAVPVALAGAALVLVLGAQAPQRELAEYYLRMAPDAGGRNATNVILANFRAFDTLVETLVVILASLGVAGLLRGIPRVQVGAGSGRFMFERYSRLLLPLAVMLALALLLKGHNAPGGGFVAALAIAIAAMLAFAASGALAFARRAPLKPDTMALVGGSLLVLCALLPVAFGDAMMTQRQGSISLFGGRINLPWDSTLIFEVGVVLGVAGGFTAAALRLWTTVPEEPKR